MTPVAPVDPRSHPLCRISSDVKFGLGVVVSPFVNIYGCELGDDVFVGPFVEIQRGAYVGSFSRIQSHTFICEGVTIRDSVFVGHGVMFINDKHPSVDRGQWEPQPTIVEAGASIGSGAVILPVHIGEGAQIGAGAIVAHDVPAGATVIGPAAEIYLPASITYGYPGP